MSTICLYTSGLVVMVPGRDLLDYECKMFLYGSVA